MKITLLETDGKTIQSAENFFQTVDVETHNCMNFREVMESLPIAKAVIISHNNSLMTDDEYIKKIQEENQLPIILINEDVTLKITRFKIGEPPSSVHRAPRFKKTDPECWKFVWEELEKLVT